MLCIGPYGLNNVLKLCLITKFEQNNIGIMFYVMEHFKKIYTFLYFSPKIALEFKNLH